MSEIVPIFIGDQVDRPRDPRGPHDGGRLGQAEQDLQPDEARERARAHAPLRHAGEVVRLQQPLVRPDLGLQQTEADHVCY